MNVGVDVAPVRQKEEAEALLAVYLEICKSYHAIDDFRTKLLGLLPLTSLVGLFLLDKEKSVVSIGASPDLLGFAAVFAALLTLALFGYEIRSIWRCHHLITEGLHIERQLGIRHGQFHVCAGEQCPDESHPSINIDKLFNAKAVACVIYSVVFSAWLFLALKMGMRISFFRCSISAVIVGLAIAYGAYRITKATYPA